jgi:hypothetical protein
MDGTSRGNLMVRGNYENMFLEPRGGVGGCRDRDRNVKWKTHEEG